MKKSIGKINVGYNSGKIDKEVDAIDRSLADLEQEGEHLKWRGKQIDNEKSDLVDRRDDLRADAAAEYARNKIKEEAIKEFLQVRADEISNLARKGDLDSLNALLEEIYPAQREEKRVGNTVQEVQKVSAIPAELKAELDNFETWDELSYFGRKRTLDTISNVFKHVKIGKEVIGRAYQKVGDENPSAVWRQLNTTIRQLTLNKDNLDSAEVFYLLAQVVVLWNQVRNSAELQKESEEKLISDLSFQFMPRPAETLKDISLEAQRALCEQFINWAKSFGMNKADIARALQVDQAYVSWYSKGERRMSNEFLEKMADLLTDYKLGGTSFAGLEDFIDTYFK